MVNKSIVVGRIATDIDLKYTSSGVAVTSFKVACDRVFKNAQGEKECDFIPCVAWREKAEFLANHMAKGCIVGVEGRIQIRKYQAQDGSDRWSTEIIADDVRAVTWPKDREGQPAQESAPRHNNGGAGGAAAYEDPFQDESADLFDRYGEPSA